MKELLDQVRAWQAEGADLGRAVVVRTFGSAPRPEGATLVVTADGRLA
ncbi:MAG: XdhC family protein, partial [Chloroflexota bacterium]